MKKIITLLAFTTLAACAPRVLENPSGPPTSTEVYLKVANGLGDPVNIYMVTSGSDLFLKQVAANSTESVPVQGVSPGTIVKLKARTSDGTKEYTRDDVTLTANYEWKLP